MTDHPASGDVSAPFWSAAARGELIRQRCPCGRDVFPPQPVCPRCHGETLVWERSSGRGRIHSFTVVHRAPTAREVPYVLAIIDLDEGWDMLANIVGSPLADVAIGAMVDVTWVDDGERRTPAFTVRVNPGDAAGREK